VSLLFLRLSPPLLLQLTRPTRNALLVACHRTLLCDEVPRVLTLLSIIIPPKNLTTMVMEMTMTTATKVMMITRLMHNVSLVACLRTPLCDEAPREPNLLSITTLPENLPTITVTEVMMINLMRNVVLRTRTLPNIIIPPANLPTTTVMEVMMIKLM